MYNKARPHRRLVDLKIYCLFVYFTIFCPLAVFLYSFGADKSQTTTKIQHILPFSRTLWDSEHNKTVSHASCNKIKGNQTPFEAFENNPSGYNWNEILERVSHLKDPQKRKLFAEDAMANFEKDRGFIDRQLHDNAYLSKMALRYLRAVVEKDTNVWSVTGGMTKLLRDKWDIDSILKRKIGDKEIAHFGLKDEQIGTYKKNRYDHRHHALDACVIALIDRSMVQKISNLNKVHKKNSWISSLENSSYRRRYCIKINNNEL